MPRRCITSPMDAGTSAPTYLLYYLFSTYIPIYIESVFCA